MNKKYFIFFYFLLLIIDNRAMEEEEHNDLQLFPVPSLISICASTVIPNCSNIKDIMSWLTTFDLPDHAQSILKSSLLKCSSSNFWKSKKKSLSITTQSVQDQIQGLALSINPDYIIVKHPHNDPDILDLKKETLLDLDSTLYEQILQSIQCTLNVPSKEQSIYTLSPDKTFIVYAQNYLEHYIYDNWHKIEIWDAQSQKLLHKLSSWSSYYGRVESLEITSNSNFIVISTSQWRVSDDTPNEGAVKVWDARTGSHLHTFNKSSFFGHLLIGSVALSNDNTFLAIGYRNCVALTHDKQGHIEIYDINTGQRLHFIDATDLGSKSPLTALAISTDNQCITAGYGNGLLKMIKLDTSNITLTDIAHDLSQDSKQRCCIN